MIPWNRNTSSRLKKLTRTVKARMAVSFSEEVIVTQMRYKELLRFGKPTMP